MEEATTKKIAVLIDAENISQKYAKLALDEAARFGTVICKRIYADWSASTALSWRKSVMDYSIHPIQQFANTVGKNSTDSAMIIDAMDLLHEGKLQGFCLISSDSDFTRLASRLREAEMLVVGMGEQKTPASFINACDKFLYLDNLLKDQKQEAIPEKTAKTKAKSNDKAPSAAGFAGSAKAVEHDDTLKLGMNKEEIIKAIAELVDENSDEEGWYFMGALGGQLSSRYPDFDSRNFGFSKLTAFVNSLGIYELRSDTNPSNASLKLVYVRRKQA
ncbi:MAG: NYN domain-containing protein [Clostridia bacterium]